MPPVGRDCPERRYEMEKKVEEFWHRFLASDAAAGFDNPVLYDVMRIGSSAASAEHGASVVLSGQKTATSSPPSEYPSREAWPYVGALSVLLRGDSAPVAVIKTTEVVLRRLGDLDNDFAQDYGEWDGTAKTLRKNLAEFYECDENQDLICERFRVVFRTDT